MSKESVKIYVPLLEEGIPTLRPTTAVPLGGNLYEVLPTEDYDPEYEIWEFPPSSIVRCDLIKDKKFGAFLRAYAKVEKDGKVVDSIFRGEWPVT